MVSAYLHCARVRVVVAVTGQRHPKPSTLFAELHGREFTPAVASPSRDVRTEASGVLIRLPLWMAGLTHHSAHFAYQLEPSVHVGVAFVRQTKEREKKIEKKVICDSQSVAVSFF